MSSLPQDISVTHEGFSLLGCPIGPPAFCQEVFRERVLKVRASLESLPELGDSQLETTLLRSCLALPKVSCVLCTCPHSYLTEVAEDLTLP